MAKDSNSNNETPNKKNESEKAAFKQGDIFVDIPELKNKMPLEITNNEKTVIDYNNKTQMIGETPNLDENPAVVKEPEEQIKPLLPEESEEPLKLVLPEEPEEKVKPLLPEESEEPLKPLLPEESEEPLKPVLPEEPEEKVNIQSVIFTLDKPIYIEIHKANLSQYISSGIIVPTKYITQKAFSDPQSFEPSAIILSNGLFSINESELLLIEISSNALDNLLLTKTLSYALYSGVIPISRIINIFVVSAEIKKQIIDTSLLLDGGLLPENLFSVGLPINLNKVIYEKNNNTINNDYDEKLQQYDKILGLIAGSRNFSLLSFNQTHSFKSISDHSLYSMQAINNDIPLEIVSSDKATDYYKWLISKSCPDDKVVLKWLFNRVYDSNNFTDSDTKDFENICYKSNAFNGEERQVELIFSSLKNSLDRKKVFAEILKLQSKSSLALYVFSFLRNYGTRQNLELPRIDISHSVPSKYSEYAFATLNFFFGYKQLRNTEERINIEDKKLSDVLKSYSKPIIKFEFNSLFDYKVIDSVFNQVFHSEIKIKENDYINYHTIKDINKASEINIDGYNYFSAILYGKVFERLIKINPIDELLPLLSKLPNEISLFSEFGLCCYRMGLKMNSFSLTDLFINPDGLKKMLSFSRNSLIDALKNNKMDIVEIKNRIELSQKHKEI